MFKTLSLSEVLATETSKPLHASPCIGHDLLRPWFYVEIARRPRRRTTTSMLMLHRPQDLKAVIESQSETEWVTGVLVVTPPHINGQTHWLMEPLAKVQKLLSPIDWKEYTVLFVEGGKQYATNCQHDLSDAPGLKVLFSAARDLRPAHD